MFPRRVGRPASSTVPGRHPDGAARVPRAGRCHLQDPREASWLSAPTGCRDLGPTTTTRSSSSHSNTATKLRGRVSLRYVSAGVVKLCETVHTFFTIYASTFTCAVWAQHEVETGESNGNLAGRPNQPSRSISISISHPVTVCNQALHLDPRLPFLNLLPTRGLGSGCRQYTMARTGGGMANACQEAGQHCGIQSYE